MPSGFLETWLPAQDYRVLGVHLCLGVMLATCMVLRRSLGAWPGWIAAFVFAAIVEAGWSAVGLPRVLGMVSFLDMMLLPSALTVLARQQCIPGLRRGEWSPQQRRAWMLRKGLAAQPRGAGRGVAIMG